MHFSLLCWQVRSRLRAEGRLQKPSAAPRPRRGEAAPASLCPFQHRISVSVSRVRPVLIPTSSSGPGIASQTILLVELHGCTNSVKMGTTLESSPHSRFSDPSRTRQETGREATRSRARGRPEPTATGCSGPGRMPGAVRRARAGGARRLTRPRHVMAHAARRETARVTNERVIMHSRGIRINSLS